MKTYYYVAEPDDISNDDGGGGGVSNARDYSVLFANELSGISARQSRRRRRAYVENAKKYSHIPFVQRLITTKRDDLLLHTLMLCDDAAMLYAEFPAPISRAGVVVVPLVVATFLVE